MEQPNISICIRPVRHFHKQSLVEMGAEIQRSKSYVDRFERNQGPLSVQELDILSKVLKRPPWELVIFHDWPLPPCAKEES